MNIVAQIFANASGQADNYVEEFFKTSNLESLCQNILGVLLSAGKETATATSREYQQYFISITQGLFSLPSQIVSIHREVLIPSTCL